MSIDNITSSAYLANCVIEKTHMGYDTFVNVCNGTHTNVPWSAFDYLINTSMIVMMVPTALFCAAFMIGLLVIMLR